MCSGAGGWRGSLPLRRPFDTHRRLFTAPLSWLRTDRARFFRRAGVVRAASRHRIALGFAHPLPHLGGAFGVLAHQRAQLGGPARRQADVGAAAVLDAGGSGDTVTGQRSNEGTVLGSSGAPAGQATAQQPQESDVGEK